MGFILSKFRRQKPSTNDELEKMDEELRDLERFKFDTKLTKKNIIWTINVFSSILCLLFYLFGPTANTLTERLLSLVPIISLNLTTWFIKKILNWYFSRKIRKNKVKYDHLKKEKGKILDDVMEKETFKVAKDILENFYFPSAGPRFSIITRHFDSHNGTRPTEQHNYIGMLMDPEEMDTGQLVNLIKNHTKKIGLLIYFIGIVWLIVLANPRYNLGTYFSENALLPGLVVENFYEGGKIDNYLNKLILMEKAALEWAQNDDDDVRIPPEKFQQLFMEIGLVEVELQNFVIRDPISKSWNNPKTVVEGTNVFGIFRAKRGSGTESLIFNAPYFPKYSGNRKNLAGIAIMLALAEYFKDQVYWAKDIVFLVGEGHLGSLAWIKGHQEINDLNPNLIFSPIIMKAGKIQAALNLVIDGHHICSSETKFHGINGQLPNLDLVNLINKFIVSQADKKANWEADIWKLVNYVEKQSVGSPSGSHGFFLKYGIESVTLFGNSGKKCRGQITFTDVGRILEAAMLNLLETYQSFFFFLKTTPKWFISFGSFLLPISLLLFPILLRAISLWLTTDEFSIDPSKALFRLLSIHSLAIFFRWTLTNHHKIINLITSTSSTSTLFKSIKLSSDNFLLVLLLMSTIQLTFSRMIFYSKPPSPPDEIIIEIEIKVEPSMSHSVVFFALLQLATTLYSLALFNPSLVIVLGVVLTPVLFLLPIPSSPSSKRFLFFTTILFALVVAIYPKMDSTVIRFFHESEVYGNFLFDLSFIILVPLLLAFIAIL